MTNSFMSSTGSTNFMFTVLAFLVATLHVLGIDINADSAEGLIVAIQSKEITAILMAGLGFVIGLYNSIKSAKIGKLSDLWKDRNWYTSLAFFLSGLFNYLNLPAFPVDEMEGVVTAVFEGNMTIILASVWALISSIIFMFVGRGKTPATEQ